MSPLLQTSLTIEYALLGVVRAEALHGYEINRRLVETPELRLVWRVKQSRLYALLARLEDEGLLDATLEPQDGRPPRKVYHLTPAGSRAFERWLTQPVQLPREMRLEFMLKLYFAQREGPETVLQLIDSQLAICERWLATQTDSEMPSAYVRAVRRYRRGHIEAIRDWLARLPAELAGDEQLVH
jgi:DNA-binding PadR family transcriptional regulator